MDLFGEKRISKGQLQRSALTFGRLLPNQIGTRTQSEKIGAEAARYANTSGGLWNYNDLYRSLNEIAKGGSPAGALQQFSQLKGPGEALSKTILLKEVVEHTFIVEGQHVQVGGRDVDLGSDVIFEIAYDVSFLHKNQVYCLLVLPRSDPIKEVAKKALVAEFAQPFAGMDKPHHLVVVESPQVSGKRCPKTEVFPFEFREQVDGFRDHLRLSRISMGEDRESQ